MFSGRFQAFPRRIERQLLALPVRMTVVRDPVERLVSFLHDARAVPALKAWHHKLTPLSLEVGLALPVDVWPKYAQSSHCRAIAGDEDVPTASSARRAIDRRYRMVCTMKQLGEAFGALKRRDLVAQEATLPHIFTGPAHDATLLAQARQILAEHAAEDAALHRMLLQDGSILRDSPPEV